MRKLLLIVILLFVCSVAINYATAEQIGYNKIIPLERDQHCYVKIEIKVVKDEVVKQEILECADGKKQYDGPSYWELYARFYYRDAYKPKYCRKVSRPTHLFKSVGTICLTSEGKWEEIK